ncbi:MAG TPA: imidazoleglycerol-phosphate dehydratase HisB [Papillibacter sp.]|jgi:imidazoleglycerol-phosphate dehydratase|nr:imidazoleglycerol-phosphate dehydratase HisB [Papillibacter sp.]
MRKSTITRKTLETDITLSLCLDGGEGGAIDTGIGFLDHMLTLFSRHGRFALSVTCKGDLHVDAHHTVEDVGLCLGMAFDNALGERRGITRYGEATVPMDEALIQCVVDVSGRSHLAYGLLLDVPFLGTMDASLVEEFLLAFTRRAGLTLHVRQLAGKNAHHIVEGCFKALARALRAAVAIDPNFAGEIPSTKGVL